MQLLIDREHKDVTQQRSRVLQQIEERQIEAERGEKPPLLIFPEGATTNGTCLIEFKKGAFASLRGVKPHFSKIKTLFGMKPVHGDSISMLHMCNLLFGHGLTHYTMTELPVFTPNEYFWSKHWDGKEEKWKLFARVV